jgi:hypothetical protein
MEEAPACHRNARDWPLCQLRGGRLALKAEGHVTSLDRALTQMQGTPRCEDLDRFGRFLLFGRLLHVAGAFLVLKPP